MSHEKSTTEKIQEKISDTVNAARERMGEAGQSVKETFQYVHNETC